MKYGLKNQIFDAMIKFLDPNLHLSNDIKQWNKAFSHWCKVAGNTRITKALETAIKKPLLDARSIASSV